MDGSFDFYRVWDDYKLGFGNLSGEFWLGNDNLATALQAHDNNELRVDLESFNNDTAYAKYSSFNAGDEPTKYILSVSGYTGTAGKSLSKVKSNNKNHTNLPNAICMQFSKINDYVQYDALSYIVLVNADDF